MQKFVKSLILVLCALVATGSANAAWTTTVYNTTVTSDVSVSPPFATPYEWGVNGVGWDYDVQWDHEWIIPSDPEFVSVTLIGASLAIDSQYTSDKTETIHLGSLANPNLGDLQDGWTPPFDVLSYAALLDGDVTVYANLFANCPDDYHTVILDWSRLILEYQITKQVWQDDPVPPAPIVPAPAALVLGGLGAGLVGWLRKRGLV